MKKYWLIILASIVRLSGVLLNICNSTRLISYYTVPANYLLEANFYNLKTSQLEYSVQTKSFDAGNAKTKSYWMI